MIEQLSECFQGKNHTLVLLMFFILYIFTQVGLHFTEVYIKMNALYIQMNALADNSDLWGNTQQLIRHITWEIFTDQLSWCSLYEVRMLGHCVSVYMTLQNRWIFPFYSQQRPITLDFKNMRHWWGELVRSEAYNSSRLKHQILGSAWYPVPWYQPPVRNQFSLPVSMHVPASFRVQKWNMG